ncbi:MAG TPA: PsbP-related protein [Candidatus Kryptonia bacterium]
MYLRITERVLVFLSLSIAFVACQKSGPVALPPLTDYRDGSNLFAIKIPAAWQQSSEPGNLNLYNTQDAWNRFADPTTNSKTAVRIHVYAEPAGAKKLDEVAESFKSELRQEQAQIDPDVPTTISGVPAVKIPYQLKLDDKNTIYSYRVLAVSDSNTYGYECDGFNQDFKNYSDVFDSIMLTYRIIPKAVQTQQLPEDLIPSQVFSTYQNDVFAIQYPDNFKAASLPASGDIQSSEKFSGYRSDCTIQVDVLDAKKLTVQKVFDQNKGKYPNVADTKKIQMDGLDAYQISYSPVRGIQSRAYFVVKNNKWIRVTFNLATEMAKDFLPAFEKSVTSLKLK